MDSGFDLEKTASPNHMGLTANVGGERALIVGWDGKQYTLVTTSGNRVKTTDYVWEYDTLADPDAMEANAKVAAVLSDESPYKDDYVPLFTKETGEWEVSKIASDDPLRDESDPEFGEDDDAESDAEDHSDDHNGLGLIGQILDHIESSDLDPDSIEGQALPIMLICSTSPELDASEHPIVQEFMKSFHGNNVCGN